MGPHTHTHTHTHTRTHTHAHTQHNTLLSIRSTLLSFNWRPKYCCSDGGHSESLRELDHSDLCSLLNVVIRCMTGGVLCGYLRFRVYVRTSQTTQHVSISLLLRRHEQESNDIIPSSVSRSHCQSCFFCFFLNGPGQEWWDLTQTSIV